MNTEFTKHADTLPARGWVFFDTECRFCVAGRRRWGRVFERRGYVWLPLQAQGTAARLCVTQEQLMAEMWVLPTGGQPLNGVSAWIELMRRVWWLSPVAFLLALPGIKSVGQAVYRWIARNRYCIAGRCKVGTGRQEGLRLLDLILLAVLLAVVLGLAWNWPGWILMWALAFAVGFVSKLVTLRDARNGGAATPAGMVLGGFCSGRDWTPARSSAGTQGSPDLRSENGSLRRSNSQLE